MIPLKQIDCHVLKSLVPIACLSRAAIVIRSMLLLAWDSQDWRADRSVNVLQVKYAQTDRVYRKFFA